MTAHAIGAAGLDTGPASIPLYSIATPGHFASSETETLTGSPLLTLLHFSYQDLSKSSNRYRRLGMFSDHLSTFLIAPFHCLGGAVAGNRSKRYIIINKSSLIFIIITPQCISVETAACSEANDSRGWPAAPSPLLTRITTARLCLLACMHPIADTLPTVPVAQSLSPYLSAYAKVATNHLGMTLLRPYLKTFLLHVSLMLSFLLLTFPSLRPICAALLLLE